MAKTTQSVTYAAQLAAAASFASRINDTRSIDGCLQSSLIKVTMDAANVATDVITLIQLPMGAQVCPELCQFIVTDDMTSGALTVHVGDAVDADRYCVSANLATVGVVPFIASNATTFPAQLATRYHTEQTGVATTDTSLITATLATFTATIEAGEFYVLLVWKSI